MKRFLFTASVTGTHGHQTFFVDAESVERATAIIRNGGGEFYAQEVEVTNLGEFEFEQETSLDDFGDSQNGEAS